MPPSTAAAATYAKAAGFVFSSCSLPSPLPPHGARLPFWLAEIAGGESSPPPPPHVCACGAFATGAEGGDGEAEIIHQCLNFIVVHWRAVLSSCYMAYYHNDAGKTGV